MTAFDESPSWLVNKLQAKNVKIKGSLVYSSPLPHRLRTLAINRIVCSSIDRYESMWYRFLESHLYWQRTSGNYYWILHSCYPFYLAGDFADSIKTDGKARK